MAWVAAASGHMPAPAQGCFGSALKSLHAYEKPRPPYPPRPPASSSSIRQQAVQVASLGLFPSQRCASSIGTAIFSLVRYRLVLWSVTPYAAFASLLALWQHGEWEGGMCAWFAGPFGSPTNVICNPSDAPHAAGDSLPV